MSARSCLIALFACIGLTAVHGCYASIFAYTDEHGTVHYSNVPNDGRYQLVIQIAAESGGKPVGVTELLRRSRSYTHLIESAARANRLEPDLVRAVMVVESGCDPKAVSRRGARGLMQLMPETARKYGVRDAFDPAQNIRAGSRYLRELTDRYENRMESILAAYNAGPAAVDSHGGGIPPWKETREYVPRVLAVYNHLRNDPRTP